MIAEMLARRIAKTVVYVVNFVERSVRGQPPQQRSPRRPGTAGRCAARSRRRRRDPSRAAPGCSANRTWFTPRAAFTLDRRQARRGPRSRRRLGGELDGSARRRTRGSADAGGGAPGDRGQDQGARRRAGQAASEKGSARAQAVPEDQHLRARSSPIPEEMNGFRARDRARGDRATSCATTAPRKGARWWSPPICSARRPSCAIGSKRRCASAPRALERDRAQRAKDAGNLERVAARGQAARRADGDAEHASCATSRRSYRTSSRSSSCATRPARGWSVVALPVDVMVSAEEWKKYGATPVDLGATRVLVDDLTRASGGDRRLGARRDSGAGGGRAGRVPESRPAHVVARATQALATALAAKIAEPPPPPLPTGEHPPDRHGRPIRTAGAISRASRLSRATSPKPAGRHVWPSGSASSATVTICRPAAPCVCCGVDAATG